MRLPRRNVNYAKKKPLEQRPKESRYVCRGVILEIFVEVLHPLSESIAYNKFRKSISVWFYGIDAVKTTPPMGERLCDGKESTEERRLKERMRKDERYDLDGRIVSAMERGTWEGAEWDI